MKTMRDYTKEKVRVLIKAYLLTNNNSECTANEIADWINNNNFGLRTTITANNIGKLLKSAGINRHNHIFNDIYVCKGNPYTYKVLEGE